MSIPSWSAPLATLVAVVLLIPAVVLAVSEMFGATAATGAFVVLALLTVVGLTRVAIRGPGG